MIAASRGSSRRALGLTEVLLGTLLLVILALPLMELLEKLVHRTDLTRLRVLARALARSAIERYRLEPLEELRRELATARNEEALQADPLLAVPDGQLARLLASHRMRRTVSLSTVGVGATAGRKAVLAASVTWNEDGRDRVFTARTLVVDAHFPTGTLDVGDSAGGGAE